MTTPNKMHRAELRLMKAERRAEAAAHKIQQLKLEAKTLKRTAAGDRKYHLCTNGAEAYDLGIRAEHAPAMSALKSLSLHDYVARLALVAEKHPLLSAGTLEAQIVLSDDGSLTQAGKRIILQREMTKYFESRETWLARQANLSASEDWKRKLPTTEQRWLIERTCEHRDLNRPTTRTSGEAHDWLEEHGANLRLKPAKIADSTDHHEETNDDKASLEISNDSDGGHPQAGDRFAQSDNGDVEPRFCDDGKLPF